MKGKIEYFSEMLRKRELSSTELTEQYIEKIQAENPVLNAYVHTVFETARRAAEDADRMLAEGGAGRLCGIPMALKANICTEGILTDCCSKMLEGYQPCYDAAVWEKLKRQGAVLLGKTNMDEFAMGSTSETSRYGAPRNPHGLDYVTGGSSGGSAAVVAADMAVYALGSDTGGSVRQPAAFCGIVGLKPTYGAVSRYGLIAYASSLDQIGTLTGTVRDAAIVFDAVKGSDGRDMTAETGNTASVSDLLDARAASAESVKGLKIGIVKEFFEDINEEVRTAVFTAAEFYRTNGAELLEFSVPVIREALAAYYIIACAEASSNLGRYDGIRYGFRAKGCEDVNELLVKSRSEGFGKEVKKRIMLGTYVLSGGYYDAYYKKACIVRNEAAEAFAGLFEKCDILLAPAAPVTAFRLGQGAKNAVELYLSDISTVPVSIAGIPAVSVPVGKDRKGLPIGMQVIGKRFAEGTILKAAYCYEQNHAVGTEGNEKRKTASETMAPGSGGATACGDAAKCGNMAENGAAAKCTEGITHGI